MPNLEFDWQIQKHIIRNHLMISPIVDAAPSYAPR